MKCTWLLALTFLALLEGCETTKEITIEASTGGTMVTTTDLSGLIGMAKMSGKSEEMEKMGEQKIDTTLSLAKYADSLEGMTAEEKALISSGKIHFQMDMAAEKFLFRVELPFSTPDQIGRLDKLSSTMMSAAMKKIIAKSAGGETELPGGKDLPGSSLDAYFDMTYSASLIEKKLNKVKYATVADDQGMAALKEMSGSGLGSSTLIINLPRPAVKAEGKNLTLSEDRKKVTITGGMEDFFDDATALEFRVEY